GTTAVESKAAPAALLDQECRRAGAVLSEVKIETDCRAADAECAGKNLLDEMRGRSRRKRGVELHDGRSGEPAGSQEAQLVLLSGQLKQGFLGPQEQSRVRRERQGRPLPLEAARALERRAQPPATE